MLSQMTKRGEEWTDSFPALVTRVRKLMATGMILFAVAAFCAAALKAVKDPVEKEEVRRAELTKVEFLTSSLEMAGEAKLRGDPPAGVVGALVLRLRLLEDWEEIKGAVLKLKSTFVVLVLSSLSASAQSSKMPAFL